MSVERHAMDKLRPASWLPGLKHVHRSQRTYSFADGACDNNVDLALEQVAESLKGKTVAGAILHRTDKEKRRIYFYFFTSNLKWLDVLTIRFCTQEKADADGHISVNIVSRSTGFFPTSIPGHSVLNTTMFFLPFSDWGANIRHIKALSSELKKAGFIADSQQGTLGPLGDTKEQ